MEVSGVVLPSLLP